MEDDDDAPTAMADVVVLTPGSIVQAPEGFLRGHGTYTQGDALIASVAGVVKRVNKLTTVYPPKARYAGAVGDVVVGRVTEVGNKRWKVEINAQQDGVLLLGSINLPGGAQRRRTLEDQLQMRSLFAENDVISGEVASFYKDGMIALQTRSLKCAFVQHAGGWRLTREARGARHKTANWRMAAWLSFRRPW